MPALYLCGSSSDAGGAGNRLSGSERARALPGARRDPGGQVLQLHAGAGAEAGQVKDLGHGFAPKIIFILN